MSRIFFAPIIFHRPIIFLRPYRIFLRPYNFSSPLHFFSHLLFFLAPVLFLHPYNTAATASFFIIDACTENFIVFRSTLPTQARQRPANRVRASSGSSRHASPSQRMLEAIDSSSGLQARAISSRMWARRAPGARFAERACRGARTACRLHTLHLHRACSWRNGVRERLMQENKEVVTVLLVCRVHVHVACTSLHADASLKFPHRTSGVPPTGRVACSVINLSLP